MLHYTGDCKGIFRNLNNPYGKLFQRLPCVRPPHGFSDAHGWHDLRLAGSLKRLGSLEGLGFRVPWCSEAREAHSECLYQPFLGRTCIRYAKEWL